MTDLIDRVAVPDPDTPTITWYMRKITLGEGPVPGLSDLSNGAILQQGFASRGKNGACNQFAFTEGDGSGNPSYLSVLGLSKLGWGRISYIPGPLDGGGPWTGWASENLMAYWGGPSKDGSFNPFGLYEYVATKNPSLPSFDGGTVTFAPSFATQIIDWGTVTATAFNFFSGLSEAPLSDIGAPAMFNYGQWALAIDPDNINTMIVGLEIKGTGGGDDDVILTPKIICRIPDDGGPSNLIGDSGFQTSLTDADDNWGVFNYNDGGPNQRRVLTHFKYKDMWPSVGVIGVPEYTHYNPLIQTDDGNINGSVVAATTDYFLCFDPAVAETGDGLYLLVSKDWTTYQRVFIEAGEEDFCPINLNNNNYGLIQDTLGNWVMVIASDEGSGLFDIELWTPGEIAEGFTGCPSPTPPPVPPVPTVVTGDVILRAWPLSLDGHDMYVIRLGLTETLIYDKYSKQWFPYTSLSNAVWAINTGFEWVGGVGVGPTTMVVGDDTTGNLYFLDPEQPYDEPQTEEAEPQQIYFDRIVQGQIAKRGTDAVPCFSALLTADMGQPAYDGAGVTLYTSDDAGETWDNQGLIAITADNFTPELIWDSLGQIMAPGRLFMLIDDGAVTRIDGLEINPND